VENFRAMQLFRSWFVPEKPASSTSRVHWKTSSRNWRRSGLRAHPWTVCGVQPWAKLNCTSTPDKILRRLPEIFWNAPAERNTQRRNYPGQAFMRILYCNKYNFGFSGTETYLFEAMELMRSRGHEVALFSMADTRGQATPYDRDFVPLTDFKLSLIHI